jgi:hypothetical protein
LDIRKVLATAACEILGKFEDLPYEEAKATEAIQTRAGTDAHAAINLYCMKIIGNVHMKSKHSTDDNVSSITAGGTCTKVGN